MRDDFDQIGMHYCSKCLGKFYEFDFCLASGYCRDCYEIIQGEFEEVEGENELFIDEIKKSEQRTEP
jgi:hypothetical protein